MRVEGPPPALKKNNSRFPIFAALLPHMSPPTAVSVPQPNPRLFWELRTPGPCHFGPVSRLASSCDRGVAFLRVLRRRFGIKTIRIVTLGSRTTGGVKSSVSSPSTISPVAGTVSSLAHLPPVVSGSIFLGITCAQSCCRAHRGLSLRLYSKAWIRWSPVCSILWLLPEWVFRGSHYFFQVHLKSCRMVRSKRQNHNIVRVKMARLRLEDLPSILLLASPIPPPCVAPMSLTRPGGFWGQALPRALCTVPWL